MSEYLRLMAGGYGFLLPREAIAAVQVIESRIAPLAPSQSASRPTVHIDSRRLLGRTADDRRKLRNLVILDTGGASAVRTNASSVSSSIARTVSKPMTQRHFKPCRGASPS
jgi:hypothetical protein